MGYTVFNIPKLTYVEIEDILKGSAEINKQREQRMKMQSKVKR